MKNFTNNFKQFTSRLSARWLIMALMLLLGTSSAWATIDVYPGETIIIDVSSHSWFNNDNCYPKLYCGNTLIGQASGFESDKTYEITLTITSVVNGTLHVSRCNSNGEYNKQYIDDRSSSKINTFKITGDGNGKWNTTQSSTNIYYLRGLGDFDKWNNIKNPYTIYLNKGEYEFKVYDSNDNWYGNDGTMNRNNCSNWTMETGKNNCKITADVAGNYTFTFNSTTKQLSVTYPELPCYTLSDVDPGTISSNATNNAICGSGSVTLKLSNTTSKDDLTRTIQWQKYNGSAWNNISNATSTTYTETISATTKYRAKVTWAKSGCTDLVEYSSENGFTITVNALPSAPSLSNPEAICQGTTFTLPEKDDSKKTITWNVNNRELTNLSVGPHKYTAKIVENGCESTTVDYTITVKEQLAKPDLAVTNVKQCGSNYTEGKIVISNHDPNNTYILKKDGNPINKAYNDGYSVSENEIGTYTVEVSKDGACGATSDDVTIEVINNTPTVTPFEITKQPNVCMGNPVTLSYNDTEQSGTVSYAWYEGTNREVLGTEKTFTIQQAKNATYKLVVTVTSNSCPANGEAEITVAPKAVPVAPTFDQDEMSACVGERFELPKPNNLIGEEEALWTVDGLPTTASKTIDEAGNYTYTAYKNDGCPSEGTEFIVHVNPLPRINIGEDVTAVKFEDVELTATGENIHNVEWTADKGTITKDPTDPKRAILTYNQTGDVIVTAKAKSSAGCESAEVSKKVTFGEENCSDDVEYDTEHVEIWLSSTLNTTMYLHRWYENGDNDTGITTWPGASTTKSDGYYKWITTSSGKIGYIFHDYTNNNKSSDANRTMEKGYRYYFTFDGGTGSATFNKSERITTTTPKPITTPAVKMLSAYSEEGSGELRMTAQIVKTGCNGNMTYYFKYRLKGAQEWSQTAAQTATGLKAGDEIDATVSNLDQGGTYEIQAVINNTNEAVSNILEYVVNIQETAISDVTLQFADSKGDVLQNQDQIYCVASTAYIKLGYRGTAHKSLEWIAENELQPVNGIDKLFSYVVRGNETITANVANDANEGTPATGTIDINVHTIATTPDISIDRTEVCSADQVGAKITVNAPQIGITYQAYKMVGDVETTHGDAVVADNAESIIINSIKETGTYYVKAWNAQCRDAIAVSLLKFAVTKIDASSNTIAISPETASTNPWMPVTVKVDKNSAYDYILVCKQGETDVTDQMVINKKGDSYVIKFPKPESAVINGNGQVVFGDITYSVTVSLNGNVECGTTSATSTITLTNLIEDCD